MHFKGHLTPEGNTDSVFFLLSSCFPAAAVGRSRPVCPFSCIALAGILNNVPLAAFSVCSTTLTSVLRTKESNQCSYFLFPFATKLSLRTHTPQRDTNRENDPHPSPQNTHAPRMPQSPFRPAGFRDWACSFFFFFVFSFLFLLLSFPCETGAYVESCQRQAPAVNGQDLRTHTHVQRKKKKNTFLRLAPTSDIAPST